MSTLFLNILKNKKLNIILLKFYLLNFLRISIFKNLKKFLKIFLSIFFIL